MAWPRRYKPQEVEARLREFWQEAGVYHFDPEVEGAVYAIDTPPATVSGLLHLGHCYSYSHTDFMARFWRMNGRRVFYPMGYDDNGLPTERLVERTMGIRAGEVGRERFIEICLQVSRDMEREYEALWSRLGLSVDWRYTYRTIDEHSRRVSQRSFLDLYRQGRAYRRQAPTIWCTECGTAIAQAELNDLERPSTFYTLAFRLENGDTLPIATTRPELLPACVAVFVHPADGRLAHLLDQEAAVPLFGQAVPVLADPEADPEKGTGAVMCCTFGDATDVEWWYRHRLPLQQVVDRQGRLNELAGEFAGLPLTQARQRIVEALEAQGRLLGQQPLEQSVRVHERCDTPVEYIVTPQWFIRLLDAKEELIEAGRQVHWYPPHMQARYQAWVENLGWDWCISRQRSYGVAFPVWYCQDCGAVVLAEEDELPVEPSARPPGRRCACGGDAFRPEEDVMDTWATSSLTPQIAGRWGGNEALYQQVFPMSLRPQAHEIIRTWAFYTIAKSHFHFGQLPWRDVAISGWGLAPEGLGKISKSRGGGPMSPLDMIERYSADAVRYWAGSTGPGKDSIISEEKIQLGVKLVNKLWNVARFSQRFLAGYRPPPRPPALSPADRWILARTQRLVRRVSALFQQYDYAAAKSETENFFWKDLADNYIEMAKLRLYNGDGAGGAGARYALYQVLLTTVKLLAPLLPYVTEEIYQQLFAPLEGAASIHKSAWPTVDEALDDEVAESSGQTLVDIATAVRRYKSERSLPLGSELPRLQLAPPAGRPARSLAEAVEDLQSITRAQVVEVVERLDPALLEIPPAGAVRLALVPVE
ncbi:MAG: valine--tRNA ligase [Chloroflexia bacterium]|nr:valine--tRNA ligase [Chloroflexia bacterium]